MAFSSKRQLLLFFLPQFFLIALSLSNPNPLSHKDSVTDIHDLLPKYNLPKGLLPGNVKSYSLSSKDNSFTIELTHPCYVQFKDQMALFDRTITGKFGYGKVSDVDGIHAKKLFIWIAITGMEVDEASNMIEFHAGIFSQSMPAEDFEIVPTCQNKGCQESQLAST